MKCQQALSTSVSTIPPSVPPPRRFSFVAVSIMGIQLPQEMLEEVIGYLEGDKATLLSCSMANSALVPASRRLLFADVTLFPHEIKAAIHLLCAAYGTIAEAIRSLTISDKVVVSDLCTHLVAASRKEEPTPDVLPLRERLHLLKRLSFESVCDSAIPTEFWRMANGLHGVQEVQVEQLLCNSSAEFFSLMSSLPALEKFTVSKSHWFDVDMGLPSPCSRNIRHIPVLDIGPSAQKHVLRWLLNREVAPTIDTLRLNLAIDFETILLVKQLFKVVGPNLSQLHLSLVNGVCDPEILDVINLSTCTNMRSLHVENRYDPDGQPFVQAFILTLFPQLSSATWLKELSWTVGVDRGRAARTFIGLPEDILLRRFSWHLFSSVFHEYVGGQIEKVRLNITEYPARLHEATEYYLKRVCFPVLEEEGKLEVVLVGVE
ncbi:hypothetical protein APHAL10511_002464 [Amanita phalloides]|nr:hypothetical protein APHAL10511_002464 [Amanita phalloides]